MRKKKEKNRVIIALSIAILFLAVSATLLILKLDLKSFEISSNAMMACSIIIGIFISTGIIYLVSKKTKFVFIKVTTTKIIITTVLFLLSLIAGFFLLAGAVTEFHSRPPLYFIFAPIVVILIIPCFVPLLFSGIDILDLIEKEHAFALIIFIIICIIYYYFLSCILIHIYQKIKNKVKSKRQK